jgi:quinolinate synthase
VLFLPDKYLGAHVAKHTSVELILWEGACEVHERFTSHQVQQVRDKFKAAVVAHPECPPDVLDAADFVGSTTAMSSWLRRERPERVALITECSMADNLRVEFPDIDFGIYRCLRDLSPEVHVPPEIAVRARRALERMLAVGRRDAV